MLLITEAKHIKDYSILINFNNGKSGILDFKEIIFNDSRLIFKPLKNKDYFKKFTLKHGTLVWENELDFAPEFLFYYLFKNVPEYHEKFKNWGYINANTNVANTQSYE